MSRLVFPDEPNTEWIAWNKLSKKTGIERFRWTAEKFANCSNTLPSIHVAQLNISLKPLKETRKSCPKPISSLAIQLPPFSGSVKSRKIINLYSKSRDLMKEVKVLKLQGLSDRIPRANFLRFKKGSKGRVKKKIRKSGWEEGFKGKMQGVVGIGIFGGGFCNGEG